MATPTYDQLISPLLRVLAQLPGGAKVHEVRAGVAAAIGLTEEERAQLLPSGAQPVFDNRLGWAHDRLKRAGLSTSVTRGFWCLTPAGFGLAAAHPKGLPAEKVAELAELENPLKAGKPKPAEAPKLQAPQTQTPEEAIMQAIATIRRSVATELLERLLGMDPAAFEGFVLQLLRSLGYGATRDDLETTGGPTDGGVDGVISLDRLGLQKVYIQAKRWQGTVGRKEIESFYGALSVRKAKMGVFVPTGSFTAQAKESARGLSDALVLIDGPRLAELMMDHGVGVTVATTYQVVKLDTDFFES